VQEKPVRITDARHGVHLASGKALAAGGRPNRSCGQISPSRLDREGVFSLRALRDHRGPPFAIAHPGSRRDRRQEKSRSPSRARPATAISMSRRKAIVLQAVVEDHDVSPPRASRRKS